MYDKRVEILFIVGMVVGVLALSMVALNWMFTWGEPDCPEFIILNGECFFEIDSNATRVLHSGNRLKLIIDDEVYWLKLETDSGWRYTD